MLGYLKKFLYVLPAPKKRLFWIIGLFVFVSSLEVFGIGLIGPFLSLAGNPETIHVHPVSNAIYSTLNVPSERVFVALLGLVISIIFIVKSWITWHVKRYVFVFSFHQRGELCKKLIDAYLNAPYTFHLSKSSAYIIQSIIDDTRSFSNSVLMTLLNSAANFIVIISLSILLCATNLLAVVVILALFLPLIFILHTYRDRVRGWGKRLSKSNEATIRTINHGIGGIKETKVIGCADYFEEALSQRVREYEESASSLLSIKLIPRIVVEAMLVIVVVGFTSIFLLLGNNIDNLTGVLGIFALASIRLMPAITNLVNSTQTLRSSSYALNKIYTDIRELESQRNSERLPDGYLTASASNNESHAPSRTMSFQNEVCLDELVYRYPMADENALDGVSLTLEKGQSIALIGKSGAGKTTLVDTILGLLLPQSGDIRVDGVSIYRDLRAWQNIVGYIPQSIFLTEDTIKRNIAFGVHDEYIDADRLDKAIYAAQLSELVQDLPEGIDTQVGERGVRLSGGQRQRIGIARALYHERDILVLDEATSALDNETEHLVNQSIQALSGEKTLIIIAHRLTTVEHCDRIYLMEKGRVVKSGSYSEVVLEPEALQ
ncbi:ABC transporter ATP-binding protein [Leptolyngbya valderiana BDU 20041]|nr:ABC transporter ATP-binding protein [Geitlerinema sp. CS-897]OAB62071.1 ABC transporter ATP-binding protein [Leptolyngbya valderiana BDU 20041]